MAQERAEAEQKRAETEQKRAQAEQERADRMAAKLRDLGLDAPDAVRAFAFQTDTGLNPITNNQLKQIR